MSLGIGLREAPPGRPADSNRASPPRAAARPEVHGKFLFRGPEKLYLIVLFMVLGFTAWEEPAHLVAGLLAAAGLVFTAHAVRVAGIGMDTALRQVQGSQLGSLPVRNGHRSLKTERT